MALFTAHIEVAHLVLDNPEAAALQVSVVGALNALHESQKLQARHAELLQQLSFEACLPRDRSGRVVLTRDIQRQMLLEGASSGEQRVALDSAVEVCGDAPIRVDGAWVVAEQVWNRVDCRLQLTDAGRWVPMFRKATAALSFAVDEEVIDVNRVRLCIENALNMTGIGMLRPSYGRGRLIFVEIGQGSNFA